MKMKNSLGWPIAKGIVTTQRFLAIIDIHVHEVIVSSLTLLGI